MKKSAVIAAAAVAALVVVTQAEATTHHPSHSKADARIAQLTRTNRQLRTQLQNMTIARNQTKTALAAADGQVSSLQSQNASLQAQVAQLTGARDSALDEVASLQAQIAAIPTPLAVAVEQVRREVVYSEAVLSNLGIPYSHGQLISQAAMDYVVGHVSAPAYGYMKDNGQSLASTPDAILGAQAGICGHAALTFAAIVKRLGFAVRSVQFYYGPDGTWNHIADEVAYDDGWHYFDPTFGIYYEQDGGVLSIADARAATDLASLLQKNMTLFWTTVTLQAGATELSDTSFATDPATVVTIDQQPFTG
jgi:Transglutaminase-like superfamily